MKKYVIKKLAYANSIEELEHMFPGGETVYVELQDEITSIEQLGFRKNYGETNRDNVVQKI